MKYWNCMKTILLNKTEQLGGVYYEPPTREGPASFLFQSAHCTHALKLWSLTQRKKLESPDTASTEAIRVKESFLGM